VSEFVEALKTELGSTTNSVISNINSRENNLMWRKILYLIITLLISSCTYHVDCPGYPEKYLVWMPYKSGQQFSLTDGIDTFHLIVETTDIRGPYTMKRLKLQKEYKCDSYAYCSITSDSLPGISYYSDGYDYGADFKIGFQFNSGAEVLQFQDNNGESYLTYWLYQHNEILSSYYNGCKVFNDVIKIESDTLAIDVRIYQVYIAKNVGIIQFKDRSYHKTWSLIE
jgi:hypothetical protein